MGLPHTWMPEIMSVNNLIPKVLERASKRVCVRFARANTRAVDASGGGWICWDGCWLDCGRLYVAVYMRACVCVGLCVFVFQPCLQ